VRRAPATRAAPPRIAMDLPFEPLPMARSQDPSMRSARSASGRPLCREPASGAAARAPRRRASATRRVVWSERHVPQGVVARQQRLGLARAKRRFTNGSRSRRPGRSGRRANSRSTRRRSSTGAARSSVGGGSQSTSCLE
jgi:hypothetical protein